MPTYFKIDRFQPKRWPIDTYFAEVLVLVNLRVLARHQSK